MNYYGYKYHEVINLDIRLYDYLSRAMYVNEGREALKRLEFSTYPKLKEEGRKKVHRRYYKQAFPQNFEKKNVVKLGDLSKVLNGR